MLKALLLSLLITIPFTATADIEDPCPDLWFSRNAMINDAGYCFKSPLGKALFDNSDCSDSPLLLTKEVSDQIALIRRIEKSDPSLATGLIDVCEINTSKTNLDFPAIGLRLKLEFQPVTYGDAAWCLDYAMADMQIHAAPWASSLVLGHIKDGDIVTMDHEAWNGWNFALVTSKTTPNTWRVAGWYKGSIGGPPTCRAYAG